MSYIKILQHLEELSKNDFTLRKDLFDARNFNVSVGKSLPKHLYTDTMIPSVGNKFAYSDFISRHRNRGIHVYADLNSISSLNNSKGEGVGDTAIKRFFNISSELSRKYNGKNFREGGDKNRVFFESPQDAMDFSKSLSEALANEKIHDHTLSATIGIGFSPEHAVQAHKKAKDQLGPLYEGERVRKFKEGEEPTVITSLLSNEPPAHWKAPQQEPVADSGMLKLKNPLK